ASPVEFAEDLCRVAHPLGSVFGHSSNGFPPPEADPPPAVPRLAPAESQTVPVGWLPLAAKEGRRHSILPDSSTLDPTTEMQMHCRVSVPWRGERPWLLRTVVPWRSANRARAPVRTCLLDTTPGPEQSGNRLVLDRCGFPPAESLDPSRSVRKKRRSG